MFYSNQLNKFSKVKHCFFSRNNGFSSGVYDSLNCGLGSNDTQNNILKNLLFVSKEMNVESNNLYLMNQTHSNKVFIIEKKNLSNQRILADALVTDIKNIAIGVLTADCVPIILYDEVNDIIGCIHAGWKGVFNNIIKNTINAFKKIKSKNKINACIGPCIGFKSYEVRDDFYKKFLEKKSENQVFFLNLNNGKFQFNIREYVKYQLKESGVLNIDNVDYDTFKDSSNFFSYRRSQKMNELDYGRCISTICLNT